MKQNKVKKKIKLSEGTEDKRLTEDSTDEKPDEEKDWVDKIL